MAEIRGKKALLAQLGKFRTKAAKSAHVVGTVGYTQHYAIYVHENLESYHPNGQAKFLEQPFRIMTNDDTIASTIRYVLKGGHSLEQAITLACLRLQRESQQLVPVDTGALRNSAFTRVKVS